jgi:hypothetical protein
MTDDEKSNAELDQEILDQDELAAARDVASP